MVMSSADPEPGEVTAAEQRSRRDLLRSGGAAAIASLLGVLGIAVGASAKDGDAVRAGRKVSATRSTTIESDRSPAFHVRSAGDGEAVGIQGVSGSSDGVAGLFIASGGGTAVEARATQRNGVALRTSGRLMLTERSGVSSVSGGAEFVIPVSGGLSNGSLVLATLQDHFPGVHVESARVLDAEEGLIVVRLNQAVPEPAKVGWIVLD